MNEYVSPVDGHRHYGDAARAECAVCRLEADRDRLSEAWTVEHDAADAAAAAVGSMAAKLSTLLADNERLEDELAVYRDQALPDAATIMNGLSKALAATETQRDRLRAAVEQALNLGEDEGMRRGKTPYPEWWVLLDRALDPRHQPNGNEEATDE